jgi:WD40-like Beta Propeller Repeat
MEVRVASFTMAVALALTGAATSGHQGQPPAADARGIALASPQVIVEVDTGKLKGDPGMLAWSPDGKDLYLQMVERDRRGAVTAAKHYVVAIDGKSLTGVDAQPPWAATYWTWKSNQTSPAAPAFKITVENRQEIKRATAAVGNLAKGGGGADGRGIPGTSAEEAVAANASSQTLNIYALKIAGETIGEWVNEPVTPGLNFGWAPAPSRLIAYAKREGGPLTVLDEGGRKQALSVAKNASFPAWSDDGSRLAWLERKDRKKFDLIVAGVSTK